MSELVSIVSPVFNEQGVIDQFIKRLATSVEGLVNKYTFEFILVDDGSDDESLEVMKKCIDSEPRLSIIELRDNFGQTPALQAGMDAAKGDIIITLDSDLQHFPEEIPIFLEKIEQGFDMVCGWRKNRAEDIYRRWPSKIANLLVKVISGLSLHDFGTTYRAYRQYVIKEMRLFGEFHRFIPALGCVATKRITEVSIRNIDRPVGKSNYNIGRTVGVLLDLIVLLFLVRYMDRPMRIFGRLALLIASTGSSIIFMMVVASYYYEYSTFKEHPGWFLLSFMLLLASLQIVMTGIIAEILVRVFYGQGEKRVYKVRSVWGAQQQQQNG